MISLRPFEIQDIPRLIQWIPDAKFLLQWAGPHYHFPLDESQLMESYAATKAAEQTHYMFKVMSEPEQKVVGHLELLAVDYQKKTAVLGRLLIGDISDRGKGYGETMIRAGLKFGFEDLDLNELDLGVFEFNRAAMNCYKKFGFQEYKSIQYDTDIGDEFKTLKRMRLSRDNWQKV